MVYDRFALFLEATNGVAAGAGAAVRVRVVRVEVQRVCVRTVGRDRPKIGVVALIVQVAVDVAAGACQRKLELTKGIGGVLNLLCL